jgi:hypothetical protein
MIKDQERQRLLLSVVLKIAPLLVLPLGLSLGTLAGIIRDFGLMHTVDNIGLNADIFVKQYGWTTVFNGWASVAVVIVSAAIVGIELIRRSGNQDDPNKSDAGDSK